MLTDPNQSDTTAKDHEIKKISAVYQKGKKNQTEDTQNNHGNKNNGAHNSITNCNTNMNNNNNSNLEKTAVRVTKTTESPYLIKKSTQIADLSVVTPEQSKNTKPVDTAIMSMIPEGDPDLSTYLTELLRTNKRDQQNNTFWFPTSEKPVNVEDHSVIQTRILEELRDLQLKQKLNPKDDAKSRMKFLERFHWTDTLPAETEKQAVVDVLVKYHHKIARHRMDIGMNTDSR